MITIEEIKHDLNTMLIGQQIHHIDSVSSTNDYAKILAKKGETEGSIIIANEQKQGRGRKQRFWSSPTGGLWFSLILRPQLLPSDAMQITMCAACAMIESIQNWFDQYPLLLDVLQVFGVLALAAVVFFFFGWGGAVNQMLNFKDREVLIIIPNLPEADRRGRWEREQQESPM